MDLHSLTIRTIASNNEAATMMSDGDFGAAVCQLVNALRTTKHILGQANEECVASRLPRHLTLDQNMMIVPQQTSSPPSSRGGEEEQQQQQFPPSGFVYERPIWINIDDEGDYLRLDYQSRSVLISVILMFNLALGYHLSAAAFSDEGVHWMNNNNAISSSSSRPHRRTVLMLKKAAKLYELAYQMAREEESLLEDSNFFSMACINNIALICRDHFDDNAAAEKCWQHLLSTLMILVDCSARGEERRKNVDRMEGYLQNTSHLVVRQTSAAAA